MNLLQIEAREKHIYWKIKKLVGTLTQKLFQKNDVEMEKYAVILLESHLKILFNYKKEFMSMQMLSSSIKFISNATQFETTMVKLRPFVDKLLFETIIPISFYTQKDIETFLEEPQDYIGNCFDFHEASYTPRNQIHDLLTILVENDADEIEKQQENDTGTGSYPSPSKNMNRFLEFLARNLDEYDLKVK